MDSRTLSSGMATLRLRRCIQSADELERHGRDRHRCRNFLANGRESTHAVRVEYIYEKCRSANCDAIGRFSTRLRLRFDGAQAKADLGFHALALHDGEVAI